MSCRWMISACAMAFVSPIGLKRHAHAARAGAVRRTLETVSQRRRLVSVARGRSRSPTAAARLREPAAAYRNGQAAKRVVRKKRATRARARAPNNYANTPYSTCRISPVSMFTSSASSPSRTHSYPVGGTSSENSQ